MFYILILFIIVFLVLINKNKELDFFYNKDKKIFRLKVANNKEDFRKGLMFVKYLPQDSGIIFKYNNYGMHSMWMKNTFIPLDILFLDHNYKLIDYVENTTPHSLKSIIINKPSKNIIELNGGSVKKFNLKKNDTINFNIVNSF